MLDIVRQAVVENVLCQARKIHVVCSTDLNHMTILEKAPFVHAVFHVLHNELHVGLRAGGDSVENKKVDARQSISGLSGFYRVMQVLVHTADFILDKISIGPYNIARFNLLSLY